MKEKRKFIRNLENMPATFVVDGQQYSGTILNIGKGSAFVNTRGSFSVGDTITVVYESGMTPTGDVKRTGKISRIAETGIGIKFGRPGYSD